jgi:hypothetical protein
MPGRAPAILFLKIFGAAPTKFGWGVKVGAYARVVCSRAQAYVSNRAGLLV